MDQKHLLLYKSLLGENEIVANIPVYEDLYSDNIEKQVNTSIIFKKKIFYQNETPRGPGERGRNTVITLVLL